MSKLRTQILAGYAVIFLVMIVIATLITKNVQYLIETDSWVNHTHSVITDARWVEKLLVDMETGERGFLITGEEEYLEPFNEGREQYKRVMLGLMEQVSDNPAQVKQLEDIAQSVEEWQQMAAIPEIAARREMNANKTSMRQIAAIVQKGIGKAAMDALRVKVEKFVDVEQELLAQQSSKSNSTARSSILVVILGTLGAILIGLLAVAITTRKVLRQVGGEPTQIAEITAQVAKGELYSAIPGDEKNQNGHSGVRAPDGDFLSRGRRGAGAAQLAQGRPVGARRPHPGRAGLEGPVHAGHHVCGQVPGRPGGRFICGRREWPVPARGQLRLPDTQEPLQRLQNR